MIETSVSLRSARSPDELAKLISALRIWIKGPSQLSHLRASWILLSKLSRGRRPMDSRKSE